MTQYSTTPLAAVTEQILDQFSEERWYSINTHKDAKKAFHCHNYEFVAIKRTEALLKFGAICKLGRDEHYKPYKYRIAGIDFTHAAQQHSNLELLTMPSDIVFDTFRIEFSDYPTDAIDEYDPNSYKFCDLTDADVANICNALHTQQVAYQFSKYYWTHNTTTLLKRFTKTLNKDL